MKNRALGMIETYGYVGAIEAADVCLKSANVELIGCELVKGGLVTVHIRGDVAAVKASIDAAQTAVMKIGRLISTHVIPRPSDDVEKILPKLGPDDPKEPDDPKDPETTEEKTNEEMDEEIEEDSVEEDETEDELEDEADENDENTQSLIKTKEELIETKTVKLRSLARKLEDKYGMPFPIERNQIKYARKRDLIEAIMEYYEGVK